MKWLGRYAAPAALVVVAATGCGPEAPDYQAIWTTTTTTTTPADQGPVPIWKHLQNVGVTGKPVSPTRLPDLTVTIPTPEGWAPYANPNFAPGTRVISEGQGYPMAMLMVFELHGDFDAAKALEHGSADAQLSEDFKELNASMEDWHGMPSSMVEGSYTLNQRRMQSYNRIVIATGSPQPPEAPDQPAPPPQRYLVQLTVSTYAEKAAEQAPDIEAIISGFNVAPK